MKKYLVTIITILIAATFAQAQPGTPQGRERIHALWVGFATDKLQLTPDQAAKFWPVCNQYEDEVRTARKKFKQANSNGDSASSMQFVGDNIEFQQQVLDLKRKYNDQFLKVISPQQLAELYKAEREFKQMLMKQRQERRGGGWK